MLHRGDKVRTGPLSSKDGQDGNSPIFTFGGSHLDFVIGPVKFLLYTLLNSSDNPPKFISRPSGILEAHNS